MRLRHLLVGTGIEVQGKGWQNKEIAALTADSREVREGSLFAAMAGNRLDGRCFIDQAVAAGAAAILSDPSQRGRRAGVPLILDPEPRRRFALMAANLAGRQPETAVAVTGTNGKTSVASFVRQLWSCERPAAALGTLGLEAPGFKTEAGLTTPDPVTLHRLLAELADAGIDRLALEASSHGLDQHRLDGVRLKAAAFTNLSRDHFDYHGSKAAYLAAKARLFQDLLPSDGVAVLHADSAEFAHLQAICQTRGQTIIDYGRGAMRLRLLGQVPKRDGQEVSIEVDGRARRFFLPLMGTFQVDNLLAALGLIAAAEPDGFARIDDWIGAIAGLQGVKGRLQRIGETEKGASVFVDFAHTPDALETVLRALRPHTRRRLFLVFGCGGDRDPGKRPAMGKIAAERADRVFITDDNPRSEEASSIRRAIGSACPTGIDIGDRGLAINEAIAALEEGDVLVIAGKGHETGQIIGQEVFPFDDVAIAKAAIGRSVAACSEGQGSTTRQARGDEG